MPQQENPVLVVIPAFNRPKRLERAIRSILYQTNHRFSMVVVDDASTSDLAPCRNLVLDRGHQWISSESNCGPAESRNLGADSRPFEWVMFLDSDDVWLPGKLERHLSWHRENPGIRISQVRESWIRNGAPFSKPGHLEQPLGRIFAECVSRCAVSPSCVAIRRDLWEETGGFDPRFRVCEDYELWLRISCHEEIGLVSGDPLVEKHGGHRDQLSTSVPALDRYRFVALATFLNRNPSLAVTDRRLVLEALEKKARILTKGAARRNRSGWDEFFRSVKIPLPERDLEKAWEYCSDFASEP
jgi:glycosyltransferase involved in cell wall biosynthesis